MDRLSLEKMRPVSFSASPKMSETQYWLSELDDAVAAADDDDAAADNEPLVVVEEAGGFDDCFRINSSRSCE